MNITSGKSSKNCSKKWYGSLCFNENLRRYEGLKIHKKREKCRVSKINVVSILHISVSFHWNIANHTIFLTSLLSSFHRCHSFWHLDNFINSHLWHIRDLTHLGQNQPKSAKIPDYIFGSGPKSLYYPFEMIPSKFQPGVTICRRNTISSPTTS